MKKLFILLFLAFSLTTQAKTIYVTISYDDGYEEEKSYTLDPKLEVWQFKDYVFSDNNLDAKKYSLVTETAEGYTALGMKTTLGTYGSNANSPVMFYIIKKHPKIKPASKPDEKPKSEEQEEKPKSEKQEEKPKSEKQEEKPKSEKQEEKPKSEKQEEKPKSEKQEEKPKPEEPKMA